MPTSKDKYLQLEANKRYSIKPIISKHQINGVFPQSDLVHNNINSIEKERVLQLLQNIKVSSAQDY
jgi:hypothetical protein